MKTNDEFRKEIEKAETLEELKKLHLEYNHRKAASQDKLDKLIKEYDELNTRIEQINVERNYIFQNYKDDDVFGDMVGYIEREICEKTGKIMLKNN